MAQSKAFDVNASQWPEFSGFKKLKSDRREIRLLQLEAEDGIDRMRYSLRHETLHGTLEYSAVSYSWGAPVPEVARKKIFVDGEPVLIRPTLYSFLATMSVHHSTTRLWIDALSINQSDVKERNHQISIMSEIFKAAQEVFVWLGPGDDDTNYAMEHMGSSRALTPYQRSIFSACVENLLRVPFWTRRWVIPEFALAKELTLVCGGYLTKWHDFVAKFNDEVMLTDVSARQTLENFKSLRLFSSQEQTSLLGLMERFQDARCIDPRDRAFALRGIAADGHQLVPHYDETVADLYFRLLSMLPTERVLPAMSGYRWPSKAASRVLNYMPLTRQDVLGALESDADDRLYTVFEYKGFVVAVLSLRDYRPDPDPFDQFPSFPLGAWCSGSFAGFCRGSEGLLPGDLIYSLRSTPRSPEGLYLAFRPCTSEPVPVGMLIRKPHEDTMKYWGGMGLCEKSIEQIRKIALCGVLMCSRNSFGTPLQPRILCHVNRCVLIMLWLLDLQRVDCLFGYLWSRTENTLGSSRLHCGCAKQGKRSTRVEASSSALEILPSFKFPDEETFWVKEPILPWVDHDQRLLRKQSQSGVKSWLGKDTPVDFPVDGRTALSYAAGDGLVLFTKSLIAKHRNKVDSPDECGNTPLWWAAYNGHIRVVQLLAESGANVNHIREDRSYGALQVASINGHEGVVKTLVDAGSRSSRQYYPHPPRAHTKPLPSRCYEEFQRIFTFAKTVQVSLMQVDTETNSYAKEWIDKALLEAACQGVEAEVLTLVYAGADVNTQGGRYGNALQAASASGHARIVQILLDGGADVNAQGGIHGHALQAAVSCHHETIMQALLDAGADVNSPALSKICKAKLSEWQHPKRSWKYFFTRRRMPTL